MLQPCAYRRPESWEALFSELDAWGGDAVLFGGGTDLIVAMRAGNIKPACVVDVKGIAALHQIRVSDGAVSIGAAVCLRDICQNEAVQAHLPALAQAAEQVGCVQIRNKATMAGNIATASPAADTLCALWGLNGQVVLRSCSGRRAVPVAELICGPHRHLMQPDEVMESVEIPTGVWHKQAFFKVGCRNAQAISVVNGLVAVRLKNGVVSDASIVIGSAGPTPLRMGRAQQCLLGNALSDDAIRAAAACTAEDVRPISDLRASAAYRTYIAGVSVERALQSMREDRHGGII